MTRYIAVPKHDRVLSTLNLAEIAAGQDARKQQIDRLKEARQRLSESDTSQRPGSSQAEARDAVSLIEAIDDLPITGISILDAAPEALDEIKARMPGFDIIEDFEIRLIPPKQKREMMAMATTLDLWHLEHIELLGARAAGFDGTGKGVGVAVLDTGIEPVSEIVDRVSESFIYDAGSDAIVSRPLGDTDGHGTHVAGLVAGKQVGVAPEADLLDVVMIPGGFGSAINFIRAIEFVAGRPEVSVMNMSAGIPGFHPQMQHPIAMLRGSGVLPVIAIGNEGRNTSRSPGNYASVLSVGAATRHNRVAAFSGGGWINAGGQAYTIPDMVAPGEDVVSCVTNGGYEAWSGTSMATPVVAGLAALVIEAFPTMPIQDVSETLLSATRLFPGVPIDRQGVGTAELPSSLWPMVAAGQTAGTG